MNNRLFLTSMLALSFAVPAMAAEEVNQFPDPDTSISPAQMKANRVYTSAANVDNMGVFNNGAEVEATAYYDIAPGYYLPADSYEAVLCNISGKYCPGAYHVTKSSSAQVLENCPAGYSSTDSGAKSKSECYTSCSANDIAHIAEGATITGKMYYGGLNNCVPSACAPGYDIVNLNIATAVAGKTGTVVAVPANSDWAVSFNGGIELGGSYVCAANKGTLSGDELDDTFEEGNSCYCWLTGANGYASNSLAVVAGTFDGSGANSCENSCPQACANMVKNGAANSQFGDLLYSSNTNKCEPHTYTYSFTCGEGGTGTAPTGGSVKFGSKYTLPSGNSINCRKEGYEFEAWQVKIGETAHNYSSGEYTWDFTDKNQTYVFKAGWRATAHTITLNANGADGGTINGSALSNGAATFSCYTNNSMYLPTWAGSGASSTTSIYKLDKIFLGWSENSSCTSASCVTDPHTCPTGDKTYYAVWADATCVSGGTGVASASYDNSTGGIVNNAIACSVTCNPGYSEDGGATNVTSFIAVGEAGAISFTPNCKKNSIFEISLDSKKYSSTSDTTGTAATTAGSPATVYLWYGNGWYSNAAATTPISKMTTRPKLDGSVFTGYYKAKAATSTTFVNASGAFSASETTGYNTNGTMYADYTECSCTNGQNVASCSATGTNENNQCTYTYTCNSGYHVGTGGTTATGTFTGSANTASNQSPNCTGNTISLTWANGGHGTTPTTPVNCTYGGTFSMPAALTETGYTFNKWNVNSKTFNGGQASVACTSANLGVTSGSATITASWTTNKINIVWNGIDNQNVKTADNKAMTNFNSSTHTAKSQVDYNGNIATPEAARAIAGQTFVGWKFVNPNNNSND